MNKFFLSEMNKFFSSKMKKYLLLASFFLPFFLLAVASVYAQDDLSIKLAPPKEVGVNGPQSLASVVRLVIRGFYLIGGIAVVIMLLWGAVEWILSGGSKDKIAAARGRIIHALIGLVILALSFVIAAAVGAAVGFNPLNPPEINSNTQ